MINNWSRVIGVIRVGITVTGKKINYLQLYIHIISRTQVFIVFTQIYVYVSSNNTSSVTLSNYTQAEFKHISKQVNIAIRMSINTTYNIGYLSVTFVSGFVICSHTLSAATSLFFIMYSSILLHSQVLVTNMPTSPP